MRLTARAGLGLVLLALPAATALFDWPVAVALLAVGLWLLGSWLLTMRTFAPYRGPMVILETISVSHYAEKVRWCLDRLGIEYAERVCAGTLGAFYTGRTVPKLHVRTGAVFSHIGNSAEILRFLWGRYGEELGETAEFLRPTAERVALEKRLDVYGADLQRWVYFHILGHRSASLRAWGLHDARIPRWQRLALVVLFPVQRSLIRRAFRITEKNRARSTERIETLLGELEAGLAARPGSLLEGGPDYTDLTLASLSSIWIQPARFARGASDDARLTPEHMPGEMLAECKRWREAYPAVAAHVEATYAGR